MKSMLHSSIGVLVSLMIVSPLYAQDDAAREVATNCKVELNTYCKDVTPGKGRVMACLYAYSDKLSDECRETVRDVIQESKMIAAAAAFLQDECREDLDTYCKGVAPGKGRLISCLEHYDDKISRRCKAALKDVGLKE